MELTDENKSSSEFNIEELINLVRQRIWTSLNEKEQDEAIAAFWRCDEQTTKDARVQLLGHLAAALRFREVFIARAPIQKKIDFVKKVIHKKPFSLFLENFVRAWLVQHKRPLLKAFLDGASIPNDDGFATVDDHPSAAQFDDGLSAVSSEFSDRDIKAYIGYLAFFGGNSGYWGKILEAPGCKKLIEHLLAVRQSASPEAIGIQQDQVDREDGPEESEPATNAQGFTTLDNHLIKTLVASAFHEEGALGEDAAEDLVDEVVEMNASRHRSLFHRGYFHALFERDFSFHFPGENSERRHWYLCGVLFGLLRRSQTDRCVDIFAVSEKELGEELAGSSGSQCGQKLLPLLCLPLLRAGHLKLALRFAKNQIPNLANVAQRVGVIRGLLGHASKLLREGKAAEAEPVFDLLQEFVSDGECELPENFRAFAGPWIKRRKAQCLQAKGSFAAAKTILTGFDFEDPDVAPYKALTDLGLIEGGFRSLAAVLPKPNLDQNKALIEGLKRGIARFQKAIQTGGESATNAHFCLGVLQTLENPTQFPQDRADRFQTAIGGMLEDVESYSANGILDWNRFLLALALLETAEPSNFLPASDLIPPVIETDLRFSAFLWERMFEAAALFDDSSLAILIGNYLLSCREEATDCLLANPALLARSEPLFKSVIEKFLSRKMPVRKCWNNLQRLLPAALSNQALEVAGTILDRMEALAITNKEFRPAFIEILKDSDRYSPAWETEDAQESLVNLLEIDGSKAEAVEILRERFFQVRGDGAPHREFALRQVLERLVDLHGDPAQFEDLTEMVEQYTVVAAPDVGETLTGKVLYIGGNETQESYRGRLLRDFGAEYPELSVEFYFPGWSSNWNVHLAKLKPMIDLVDVVVINPLIRTQLGRHLRAYCNAEHPWLPCTGRGFESLKRSIIMAALWVNSN